MGLEFLPIEVLALRIGILAGSSSDIQKDHGMSGGFGIRLRYFEFDAGIGQSNFGIFYQFSVRSMMTR